MTPVIKSMTKRNILTGIMDRNKNAKSWEIVRDNKTNNNEWFNSKFKKKNNILGWKRCVFKSKRWERKWNFKIVRRSSSSSINNKKHNSVIRNRIIKIWSIKNSSLMIWAMIKEMMRLNQLFCKRTSSIRIFSYHN